MGANIITEGPEVCQGGNHTPTEASIASEQANLRTDTFKVAAIGLGKVMQEDHLPAVIECPDVRLNAVCDTNPEALGKCEKEFNAPGFGSVDELLAKACPDLAIVAVPHNQYIPIVRHLASAGVHILKEKPLATSLEEAREIDDIVTKAKIHLMLALHRRFHPLYHAYRQLVAKIGRAYAFNYIHTLNLQRLDQGWRATHAQAGGGCLLDMGYHTIDMIVQFFGLPKTVHANMSYGSRESQCYDVEDTCQLSLRYEKPESRATLIGDVFISRAYPEKLERLVVLGTKGVIRIDRSSIARLDLSGATIEELKLSGGWRAAHIDQLNTFVATLRDGRPAEYGYRQHYQHLEIIEKAYESNRTGKVKEILSQENNTQ